VGSLVASSLVATSRSKYSLIAAARGAALAALAELAFLAALLVVYARCGSASFEGIGASEVAHALGTPSLGLVLLAYALFEARRPPMDHTEAESELVAGHLVEFGGRALLAFFICEYAHVYFCLFAILTLSCGGLWAGLCSCAFVS
jgi:NADH-quinone oxidoreductase subunit H